MLYVHEICVTFNSPQAKKFLLERWIGFAGKYLSLAEALAAVGADVVALPSASQCNAWSKRHAVFWRTKLAPTVRLRGASLINSTVRLFTHPYVI